MHALRSVDKPAPDPTSESAPQPAPRIVTRGQVGTATGEQSRSLRHLVVKGKGGRAATPALETVIGSDDRVRVLDTDLAPWRMICALHMRGPDGAGAIGTGWFIGPKTLLTAGHCVFSGQFFGGWASSIEVVPGCNGAGADTASQPYGAVASARFSSLDQWVEREDPDFDIGCIHLDAAKGTEVGWFSLAALPPEELQGYLVNVAGYPADRGAGHELLHASGRVLRVSDRRVFYDTDTYGGQSGAAAWIHERDGAPPLAVGVHAYGAGGTPADLHLTANSAPRITQELLAVIQQWVAADGGWPAP